MQIEFPLFKLRADCVIGNFFNIFRAAPADSEILGVRFILILYFQYFLGLFLHREVSRSPVWFPSSNSASFNGFVPTVRVERPG